MTNLQPMHGLGVFKRNHRNPSISEGIIQSLSKLWENREFEDFKVKVDGEFYSCHSLILASCSEFFAGLLRSNMKEKQEMKVEITNISSPIFQLILNSLYTGCELLTKDNVSDVWSAVHQLQIQFLIEHCEDFVETNLSLDTLETYEQLAKHLQSVRICRYIFNFKCKNFQSFRKTKAMFQLDFQEFINIIQSYQLEVSCEDKVLFSIFDWVSHEAFIISSCEDVTAVESTDSLPDSAHDSHLTATCSLVQIKNPPELTKGTDSIIEKELTDSLFDKSNSNERKNALAHLLKATRYCLASKSCIIKLYEHKLTQHDTKVKDILFQALSFKSSRYCHGFCPIAATHRDCSNFGHFGVYCDYETVKTFCIDKCKTCSISTLKYRCHCNLTVHNGEIYALMVNSDGILVLQNNIWEFVVDAGYDSRFILSNDEHIYSFRRTEMKRFKPNKKTIEVETFSHNIQSLQYALSFHNNIVVFSSAVNNGVEETAVHSWNTETNVWTQLDSLEFSSQNMVSFCDDKYTYILDPNGNLWKLTDSEIIEFTFVKKLWSRNHDIKGAVLFSDRLVIIAKVPHDSYGFGTLEKVDGVFSSIQFRRVTSITSNFIHYVTPANKMDP